jgi:hypothetical protein
MFPRAWKPYFDADPESRMEQFGSGMRKRRIRITKNLNAIVNCAFISYAHLGQITFGDQDPSEEISVADPVRLSRIQIFSFPDPNFFLPGSKFFLPGSALKIKIF